MTKVEQVALAIWQKKMNTKDGVEIFNRLTARQEWLEIARAAIQAMREPTDQMKDAGCAIAPDTNSGCFGYGDAEDVYGAMIDAALSETSEES